MARDDRRGRQRVRDQPRGLVARRAWRASGAYRYLGRFDEALGHLQKALDINRELLDRRGEGWTLGYLGATYHLLGRFDEAVDRLQRALAIARDARYPYGEGLILSYLGLALQETQDMEAARSCWRKALVIFTEIASPEAEHVRALLEGESSGASGPTEWT